MDPLALTAEALREPWRLWTCHLLHHDGAHALVNGIAAALPLLLARPASLRRILPRLAAVAPLLALALLPLLGGGSYRGASGLACALWALVGADLLARRESAAAGLLLLGALAAKLALEPAAGSPFLGQAADWRPLPAAHAWGAILGLLAALPSTLAPRLPRAARR